MIAWHWILYAGLTWAAVELIILALLWIKPLGPWPTAGRVRFRRGPALKPRAVTWAKGGFRG